MGEIAPTWCASNQRPLPDQLAQIKVDVEEVHHPPPWACRGERSAGGTRRSATMFALMLIGDHSGEALLALLALVFPQLLEPLLESVTFTIRVGAASEFTAVAGPNVQ
eukprot:1240078-Pleurochrysis_carterae.AAC.1